MRFGVCLELRFAPQRICLLVQLLSDAKDDPLDVTKLAGTLPGMLPRLWAFALRISRDHRDAEILVQRTCKHALESASDCHLHTSPSIWLFSILHSIWFEESNAHRMLSMRGVRCENPLIEPAADAVSRENWQNSAESRNLSRHVLTAVDQLPDAQRVVMLLNVIEGFTYHEIADVLGVSITIVMHRILHARQTVGRRLAAQ